MATQDQSNSSVFGKQRQKLILDEIMRAGKRSVKELAERFDVTTETIRRDLSTLADQGLVEKVHGGAVAKRTIVSESAVAARHLSERPQKEAIARRAAELIVEKGARSAILDAGSTTGLVVQFLAKGSLEIVTNDPTIASESARAGFGTQMLPGRIRPLTLAAVGSQTVEAARSLNADVVLLGTNAISETGLSTPDYEEAAAKAALVRAGQYRVVLADSSKFSYSALHTFAQLEDVDAIITDSGIDAGAQAICESAGVDLIIVEEQA